MNVPAALIRLTPAAVLAVVLAACGGGGDSNTPVPAPAPVPPSIAPTPTCTGSGTFSIVGDVSVVVGKAAGAVLAGCTGAVSNVQWTQTVGPALTLISSKSRR